MSQLAPFQEPYHFSDLDERPELAEEVLALFRRFGPGRFHAVNGEPSNMGQLPSIGDLLDCLGVLIVLSPNDMLAGALGICPYSSTQVTLWGPVVSSGHQGHTVGTTLLNRAKDALREGGFESARVLNDTRNRRGRSFFLKHGMTPWKDNHLYEHALKELPGEDFPGVSLARSSDHREVEAITMANFPESSHCNVSLQQRERQGYRHYILQVGGTIVATAAVKGLGRRSWMSLIGVHPEYHGQGYGTRLLRGLLKHEFSLGSRCIGLEVLADNLGAMHIYAKAGFQRRWTSSILVGPL